MKTTPTAVMETPLCLPPQHLYLKELVLKAVLGFRSTNLWKIKYYYVGHSSVVEDGIKKLPLLAPGTENLPPRYIFGRKFNILINTDI